MTSPFRGRAVATLSAGCGVMIALVWALAGLSSWSERRQTERTAVLNGEKLTAVMADSVIRMVQSLGRDFDRLDEGFTRPSPTRLREPSIAFTAWRSPDGKLSSTSVFGLSRLRDLRWPASPESGRLVVGPTLARNDGADRVLVPFYHFVPTPKGDWTVAAVVDFSWMESFFTGVDNWGMTSVSVFAFDGTLLFRYPPPPKSMNVNFLDQIKTFENARKKPSGSYLNRSLFDGRERLVVYRTLGDIPIILTVNHETGVLYAPWKQHSLVRYGLALMGSLLILFFAFLVLRYWRRIEQERAGRRLFEQSVRRHDKLEAVGRFSGALAHDFNNILTLAFGALDRLEARADASGTREVVDRLLTSTMKARDLVKQIRAFSRPSGALPKPLDLQDAVERAANLLRGRSPLKIEVAPTRGRVRVKMDPLVLEQVLLETFSLPSSEAARLRLRVAIAEEAAAPMVRVALHFLPERGFAPDEAASRVLREHLLLTSVRPLLESCGGWLEFQTAPGAPALSLLLPAETREPAAATAGERASVLFVDSEEAVVELVQDFLRGHGLDVFATWDTAAALEEFRRRPQDFALAVTEGRQNAADLAHALREIRPELPLLLLAGAGRPAVAGPVFPDENIAVLEKPYRFQDLLAEILRLEERGKRGFTLRPL